MCVITRKNESKTVLAKAKREFKDKNVTLKYREENFYYSFLFFLVE